MIVRLSIILFMLCVYTAWGQSVELGILRDHVPTLRYRNGNCSWRLTIENLVMDDERAFGPDITLPDVELLTGYTLNCMVGEEVRLNVMVSLYDTTQIPPPMDLIPDVDNSTLEWSHLFQPVLPHEFVLIQDIDILYRAYVTDTAGFARQRTTDTTTLDISDVLDSCTEREFVVQTVVNGQFDSPNSSSISISNFSVPVFRSLSAYLLVHNTDYSVQVIFELEMECRLSEFIIIIGIYQTLKDVTSGDINRGNVTLNLPLNISSVDVCSLVGVVSGGNDIGQSEPVDIHLPPECDNVVPSSSVTTITVTPTMTPTTANSDTPTPKPTPDWRVIIAVTVCLVIVIAVIAAVIILVLVYFRTKRKTPTAPTAPTDTVAAAPTDNVNGDRTLDKKPPKPLTYTFVRPQKTGTTCQIPLVTKTTSEYAQIDHFKTEELNQETQLTAPEEQESHEAGKLSKDPAIVGFSVENHLEPLLAVLEPVKRDWYDLGMHLNLSENFLDETETIIDTVEECLKEMIQNWLRYHEPTMERLNRALTEIKRSPVTFDTSRQEFVSTGQES